MDRILFLALLPSDCSSAVPLTFLPFPSLKEGACCVQTLRGRWEGFRSEYNHLGL